MKIGGPPPRLLPPPPARQDEPARAPGESREGRGTFGFDELGLFGLHRSQATSASGRQGPARCPEPAPPVKDVRAHLASPPAATRSMSRAPAPPLLPKPSRPPVAQPERPDPQAATLHGPDTPGGPDRASAATVKGDPPKTKADASAGARQHSAPARPGISLTVAEKDGRLGIAAGAPPLDGEGRALLRRLAREILAEHGLTLADFQLNGAPLAADFQEMTGGIHGTRSD